MLDGWARHSRHRIQTLTLPAHDWKWRMRHSAVTFATMIRRRRAAEGPWDLLWCTDMTDLATLRALTGPAVTDVPAVAYFHENQLTYPTQHDEPRDLHFALTNFTTALAADAVWFNSDFHRRSFLDATGGLLHSMPDHPPLDELEAVREKALVQHPGVDVTAHVVDTQSEANARQTADDAARRPLHLAWAARWEHDKNPWLLFDAVDALVNRGVELRLSIIGEQFRQGPPVFDEARARHADRIVRWGYQSTRAAYLAALREADVFISTADHEFFGLAAVEAAACGCACVLPRRLAYPEVFGDREAIWYDGSCTGLVEAIERFGRGQGVEPGADADAVDAITARYRWPARAAAWDDAIDAVALRHG